MAIHALEYLENNPDFSKILLTGSGHAWKKGIPEQIGLRSSLSYTVLLSHVPGNKASGTITYEEADYISCLVFLNGRLNTDIENIKRMRIRKPMNYCSNCGARVVSRIPADDDRPRFVCDKCHTVHYENPKVVVGCIPEWEDRILLCRRAIEPCYGLWTLPAGFLENGETVEEGASREAYEEVQANVKILTLYTLLNLTRINQIYLIFRAQLVEQFFKPGHETLEAKLFIEQEIPWDDLAFLSIKETLRLYFLDRPTGEFPLHMGRIPDDE